jgi:hypothetical protein
MLENRFSLEISEPYTADSFLAPVDPLGELPEAEMSFRKFCFDENHVVSVRVCNKQKTILLFPDIALAYPQLRAISRRLRQNLETEIDFPERMFRLIFKPKSGSVECCLEEFGYHSDSIACVTNLEELIATLTGFTDDVLARVVDTGYLTQEQADQLA